MSKPHGRVTADAIERAAVDRYATSAASVVRYVGKQEPIYFSSQVRAVGVWYVLSVKRHAAEWETMARRRTLGELLALVELRRLDLARV